MHDEGKTDRTINKQSPAADYTEVKKMVKIMAEKIGKHFNDADGIYLFFYLQFLDSKNCIYSKLSLHVF